MIEYDVRGALRHFDDHSELYWDATGSGWDAERQPGHGQRHRARGVQQVDVLRRSAGIARTSCQQKVVAAGRVSSAQSELDRGDQLTIVAGITAGVVTQRHSDRGRRRRAGSSGTGCPCSALIGSGVVTLGAIVAAVLYSQERQQGPALRRYAAGHVPAGRCVGCAAVKDDLSEDQIPVAFSPPRIPVAEGGLLIDAKANTTETAATLIDLAVRGARPDRQHRPRSRRPYC